MARTHSQGYLVSVRGSAEGSCTFVEIFWLRLPCSVCRTPPSVINEQADAQIASYHTHKHTHIQCAHSHPNALIKKNKTLQMNKKLFAWLQSCELAATCIIYMKEWKSTQSKKRSAIAVSSRVERGRQTENHWRSISCACCCLRFISARLHGIRYPLMEGKGSICQRPVT